MRKGILTTMMAPIPKRVSRAPGFPGGLGKGMRGKALPVLFEIEVTSSRLEVDDNRMNDYTW